MSKLRRLPLADISPDEDPLYSSGPNSDTPSTGAAAHNLNMIGSEIQMTAAASGVVPDDTFTVTQAVNKIGFGKFQMILSVVTGLCWMADSMEMMILSILPIALHCEWGINQYSQAFLTTVVFLGMMVSSTFWGKLSDKFGRKQSLVISGIFLFLYGFLSTFSPSYPWILCLRFMVGFNIGCVPQSVTLYAEFLPTKERGKCVVLLDCFWALGACLEVLLAMLVMPTLGWRWLLAFSSLPSLCFVLACSWLPESARYHVSSGESQQADHPEQDRRGEPGQDGCRPPDRGHSEPVRPRPVQQPLVQGAAADHADAVGHLGHGVLRLLRSRPHVGRTIRDPGGHVLGGRKGRLHLLCPVPTLTKLRLQPSSLDDPG